MMRREPKEIDGWREFQIQRLNILLHLGLDNPRGCDESDLFAWSRRVYPTFSSSVLHEGFEDCFFPTKEMMSQLAKRLDTAFMSNTDPPTVYELEDEFNVRLPHAEWDRGGMINALRYMSLCEDRFNKKFWQSMIRDFGAPAEANTFFRPFEESRDASPH